MASQDVYSTEIARLFPPQGQWSEEDYFALPDSMQIIELSDGEIVMPAPPVPLHQQIVMRLGFALNDFARKSDLGSVYLAPVSVRLWKGKIREPDFLFIRKEHANRVHETRIEGAPDWVAEVISPGTRKTDEGQKILDYAQAGIPEYWLIDPKKETIRVYHLADVRYELIRTYAIAETARAETMPGFEIALTEVFGK